MADLSAFAAQYTGEPTVASPKTPRAILARRPSGPATLKELAGEYALSPPEPTAKPSRISEALTNLRNLPKVVTEGVPAAARAFGASQAAPTLAGELREEASRPGTSLLAKSLYGRYGIPGHLLELVEGGMRLPSSFGRAAAELGPEKAKPLTEAMASNLPFLGTAGARALTTDARGLLQRPTMPAPAPRPRLSLPPGGTQALPPGAYAMPPAPERPPPLTDNQYMSRVMSRIRQRDLESRGREPRLEAAPSEVTEALDRLRKRREAEVGRVTPTTFSATETPSAARIAETQGAPRPPEPPTPPKPLEPTPVPIGPRLAPASEMTKEGEQAILAGTPAREMPTTALRKEGQKPIEDTPLFGQEKAARQHASDAAQQSLIAQAPVSLTPEADAGLDLMWNDLAQAERGSRTRHIERQVGKGKFEVWTSQPSTFPDWLAQPYRTRKAADQLMAAIDNVKAGRNLTGKLETEVRRMAEGESVQRSLHERYTDTPLTREAKEVSPIAEQAAADLPPEHLRDTVKPDEWQGMTRQQREGLLGLFGITDEGGFLDLGKILKSWHRFRGKFPQESRVRIERPNSPVISEVERWNAGLADGLARIVEMPWWKAVKKLNPEGMKDTEEQMVNVWRAHNSTLQARALGISHAPPDLQAAMRHREQAFQRENASRLYFGLPPIKEEVGPYLPRVTDKEMREAVQLGGGDLGVGRGLQSGVAGHGKARVFETYRAGEAAGTAYEDPRNAILLREWQGLKLRATHRLFQNLEAKGGLFRDRGSAALASPTGRPWRVEHAPGGGTWWTATEAEAKFLEQNLTEAMRGPTTSLVGYANALLRNPNLVNPAPHVVKNMAVKALLARGPVTPYVLVRDAVEWARGANPTLLREFSEAMPFSTSGRTAGDLLGRELRSGTVTDAIRRGLRLVGQVNRPSQKVIFEWADPAMRYAMFKHYRNQGLGVYEAGNHAWVDLIRYGTRSRVTDFWKAMPFNFFVPWRYGTFTALLKQAKNHPVRTALLLAGVDYLREMRYRTSGKWTHLPWDYVEAPVAQLLQSKDAVDFAKNLGSQAALTALFGPGGAFAASQIDDMMKFLTLKGDAVDARRLGQMFWGLSQVYNLPEEFKRGDYSGMLATALLGEHNAVSYQPRRLMRGLSESLPGMAKSPLVHEAERRQQARDVQMQRTRERRATHPRRSIEDHLREQGYLK